MDRPLALIEFPADDLDRARRFWSDLLGVELAERSEAEGRGWQTHRDPAVGIHERGTGPGDTVSLPYFTAALSIGWFAPTTPRTTAPSPTSRLTRPSSSRATY